MPLFAGKGQQVSKSPAGLWLWLCYIPMRPADLAQLVELLLPKQRVVGSNPIIRSNFFCRVSPNTEPKKIALSGFRRGRLRSCDLFCDLGGGAKRSRTADLLHAMQALYQTEL